MASLDWGSVPLWFGTLFTSASAAVAAISICTQRLDRGAQ